jgi:hypothetical protein
MGKDVIPIYRVAEKILYLREQKIILDRDLASLYCVQTPVLILSRAEIERISQFVTSSSTLRFSKQVRAFTEEGVAMRSSVWTGERTRLACWRWRHRELFQPLLLDKFETELKESFSARRRKQHARRVCSLD